jgi:hypothetical protein
MSDNSETREPTPTDVQPGAEPPVYSRSEERRRRREERRAARGGRFGGGWVGGAMLIAAGALLLLQNLTGSSLGNWWALLLLIPALSAFAAALRLFQRAGGHLTAAVRGLLISGLVLTMAAAVFLLDLNWSLAGPILLILAGIAVIVNMMLPA